MLTEQSYMTGLLVYLSSAALALVLLHRYWFVVLPRTLARLLTGLLAGVLLAPAYPSYEAETLAPALIVAVFNLLFVDGWPSAQSAVVIVVLAGIAGMILAAFAGFVLPSGSTRNRRGDSEEPAGS